MKSWTLTLEEDPETGELILPFTEEILAAVGWQEGDTVIWKIEDGRCTLTKKSV